MDTAVINIKTEAKVKFSAQKIAKEMGLSLSALINSLLKQVIRTKKITLDLRSEEEPSEMLIQAIKEAENDLKNNRLSPSFDNGKDAIDWLNNKNRKYAGKV